MEHIPAINPFATTVTPARTRWIGMGACSVRLGSTALVWRYDR
jgi:hypothetical protein